MKKQFLTSAVVALAGIGLLAGTAVADNIRPFDNGLLKGDIGSQDSLQEIIDGVFGSGVLDAVDNQSTAARWESAEAAIDAYMVTSQNLGYEVTLGLYNYNNSMQVDLVWDAAGQASFLFDLDGDLWVGGVEYVGFGNNFGFYTKDRGTQFYTEDSLNGGNAQALTYVIPDGTSAVVGGFPLNFQGDNDWLIAFESYVDPSYGDYNDMVFVVEDMNPVPEPTTMLLFGTGLAGLAAVARRRRN